MNVDILIKKLKEIDEVTDEKWVNSLNDRKKKELEFHDRDRDKSRIETLDKDTYEKLYGNKKYYQTVGLSSNYVNKWIEKNSKNKIFLDYACGNGMLAIKAAKAGATLVIGIDISSVSVKNARQDAIRNGVEKNSFFVQADCENTKLPDNSIDVIICSGMLHHLDLTHAFPELKRILAPGGKILAVEALNYNPLIMLYRYLTPQMRTDWEKAHILGMKDIRFAKRFFKVSEIKYWHMLSIVGAYFKPLLPIFNLIDRFLTKVPLLRLMSWIFTFELVKQKK